MEWCSQSLVSCELLFRAPAEARASITTAVGAAHGCFIHLSTRAQEQGRSHQSDVGMPRSLASCRGILLRWMLLACHTTNSPCLSRHPFLSSLL